MGTYIRRALEQDIESATHSRVNVITGPHRSGLNPTICIQRIVCRFHLACSDAANNFGSMSQNFSRRKPFNSLKGGRRAIKLSAYDLSEFCY